MTQQYYRFECGCGAGTHGYASSRDESERIEAGFRKYHDGRGVHWPTSALHSGQPDKGDEAYQEHQPTTNREDGMIVKGPSTTYAKRRSDAL